MKSSDLSGHGNTKEAKLYYESVAPTFFKNYQKGYLLFNDKKHYCNLKVYIVYGIQMVQLEFGGTL